MSFRFISRAWWGLGITILAVSFGVVCWTMRAGASGGSPPEPVAEVAPPRSVFAFGHVDLEQGVAALSPGLPGRVSAIPVREGDKVEQGATLLRLDDTVAASRVREAESDLAGAEERLAESKRAKARHSHRVKQQKAALLASQHRLQAAKVILDRKRKLNADKLLSADEVLVAEALAQEAEAGVTAEEEKLRELELADPSAAVRGAEIDVLAKKAKIEQARYFLSECTLKAPTNGEVLRVLSVVGDQFGTTPRQPAMFFAPAGPRIVRAEVEQEQASRVRIGQEAIVTDDTRSGDTWRGKVLRMSGWYTQRRSILLDPLQFNDVRTLECIIEIREGQDRLRIGQRVRVKLPAEGE